ncbi:MAG: PTS sugar transporter subunit IIA [Desulfobacteraceae bacterium]
MLNRQPQHEAKKAMIGVLIISHCNLGKELLRAAELIVGKLDATDSIPIMQTTESEEILKQISKKIAALDQGQGVLVLTDMFGGTPSNLSLSFLKDERVEVLTGVNLPMLIAVAKDREGVSLSELGEKAEEAGRRSITLAGKLLNSE